MSDNTNIILDIKRIMNMIPHRYPFLLIDRITAVENAQSITAIKNVTMNENFFMGHFPGAPVMPGVLIVEAMAQAAGVLVVHSLNMEGQGKLVYFMTIDNCKFRRPVTPGDQLVITSTVSKSRGNVWKFTGVAKVDGQICAEAEFSAMIVEPPES
jgi:3-hydroxyacyl-[acyl-carrier-protein] dehydratase